MEPDRPANQQPAPAPPSPPPAKPELSVTQEEKRKTTKLTVPSVPVPPARTEQKEPVNLAMLKQSRWAPRSKAAGEPPGAREELATPKIPVRMVETTPPAVAKTPEDQKRPGEEKPKPEEPKVEAKTEVAKFEPKLAFQAKPEAKFEPAKPEIKTPASPPESKSEPVKAEVKAEMAKPALPTNQPKADLIKPEPKADLIRHDPKSEPAKKDAKIEAAKFEWKPEPKLELPKHEPKPEPAKRPELKPEVVKHEPKPEAQKHELKPEPVESHRQEEAQPPRSPAATISPIDKLRDPKHRNTFLGIICLAISLVILAAAITLGGAGPSLVAVGSSLLALSALWVLWRLGLPQQPRGLFLSIGITCFASLLLPLLVGMIRSISPAAPATQIASAPTPAPSQTPPATAQPFPLLSEKFEIERPDPDAVSYVEVLKDSKIKIDSQAYRINAGERFELQRVSGDEVIFKARDFLISLPLNAVSVHRKAKPGEATAITGAAATPAPAATPALSADEKQNLLDQIRKAQDDAVRRYPALAIKESRENKAYVGTYMNLKDTNPDFFKDPEWPLQLAEALAERDGWQREDVPSTPKAEPVSPPGPSPTPGERKIPPGL